MNPLGSKRLTRLGPLILMKPLPDNFGVGSSFELLKCSFFRLGFRVGVRLGVRLDVRLGVRLSVRLGVRLGVSLGVRLG